MEEIVKQHIKNSSLYDKVAIIYASFSPHQVLLLWTICVLFTMSIASSFVIFSDKFLIKIPAFGGSFTEGIIGNPRFINPILAITEQDKSLTALIFSGLTKDSGNGEIILDLASNINVSEDKLTYTVDIRENAQFHDGHPVTSEDIVYTISLIQDPVIKSPEQVKWEGIGINALDQDTVVFTLKKPYPAFYNNLSIGILPKHLWKDINSLEFSLSDYNINAVGSGPYSLKEVKLLSGIPREFSLEAFSNYSLGKPYIQNIHIIVFQNEKTVSSAMTDGQIDQTASLSATTASEILGSEELNVGTTTLPRVVTVFFNANKNSLLSNKQFRATLSNSLNKYEIRDIALKSFGDVSNSPYPFDKVQNNIDNSNDFTKTTNNVIINSSTSELVTLTISTANTEEMRLVATLLEKTWEDLGIGLDVVINYYDLSDLNTSIIRNRDFELLLFPIVVNDKSDLYAFWHSSQRNYPGLNISNFVSKKSDDALEILKDSDDKTVTDQAYDELLADMQNQIPAIFLYSPNLIYVSGNEVKIKLGDKSHGVFSRYGMVEKWFIHEEKIWPIFNKENIIRKIENYLH